MGVGSSECNPTREGNSNREVCKGLPAMEGTGNYKGVKGWGNSGFAVAFGTGNRNRPQCQEDGWKLGLREREEEEILKA